MVSVSRRALAPHRGQSTARKASSLSSGLPLPSGTRSTGSTTGNCSSGTGTVPQLAAMNHRNRAAPVALPRNPPIAQPPGGALLAQARALQIRRDGIDGGLKLQAVVHARIDAASMLGIPGRPCVQGIFAARHVDDRLDRQMIFFGEFEIPLIVRRHAHDRAVAVAHEHIVAHPHRHRLAADGMAHRQAGRHALFLLRRKFRFDRRAALALLDECRQRARYCAPPRQRADAPPPPRKTSRP